MNKYKYIIIGGGMTGDAAIEGIRELDKDGSVLLICAESHPPYNRPPLSKALWKGKSLDIIWRNSEGKKAEILLDRTVESINPFEKTITDNHNSVYGYEKLLLATGGINRRLNVGGEEVIYYRTIDDYQKLKQYSATKQKFGVIGTGFIGSEISAALAMNGKDVTVFDIGPGIGWNIFPKGLSDYITHYFFEKNIKIVPKATVTNIVKKNGVFLIKTDTSLEENFDVIVAGIGIVPNTSLAESINLDVDNGIVVNEY